MSEVRLVDRTVEPLLRSLWEIGARATAEAGGTHDYESWRVLHHRWSGSRAGEVRALLAAYDESGPVGYADLGLPTLDNTHLAEIAVYVDPDRRRRGHGSALLDAVVEVARETGRRSSFVGITAGLEADPPGLAFARRHGFQVAQVDQEKVAALTEAPRWSELLAEVAPASASYAVGTWCDRFPPEHVEALCTLRARFVGEIPLGELDLEPEVWTPQRLAEVVDDDAATGRRRLTTLAIAPGGAPAGYTEVVVDEAFPEIAFQESTLVLPEHRGHRLGLRIKLANQVALAEQFPAVRTIETGNAVDNDHMNAVNEQLGFVPVGRWFELQRAL